MMGPEAPEAVDSVRENLDIIMGTVESLHFDVLADQKDKEAFMARKKDMESFCQCASKALRSLRAEEFRCQEVPQLLQEAWYRPLEILLGGKLYACAVHAGIRNSSSLTQQ